MTNHPNRSQNTHHRYVVYSLSSHNALQAGPDAAMAVKEACEQFGIDDEFLVVFSTRSKDGLDRFDAGRWPRDAKVVFRGKNELAQTYKA